MPRLKRIGLIVLSIIVVGLALIGALSITRGTPVGYVVTLSDSGPPPVTDSLFERTFELFTGAHIFPGNVVTPAMNGDGTYPQLWTDLRAAQRTITVQMSYSLPGKVADTALSANVARTNQVWQLGGNTGADAANGAFVGTRDYQPLEFKTFGFRGLRLEPSAYLDTVNVIGGSKVNSV